MVEGMSVLALTEQETASIKEITALYQKVKELVIEAEEWDEKDAFAPTLLEFRNSLDHLMRFYAFKFGYKRDVPDDYSSNNLLKTKAHLFRAGYDSLDYLSVEIARAILDLIESYSNEAIVAVMPEYFERIRPDIDKISTTIAEIRAKKDMDNRIEDFNVHTDLIKKLRLYHDEILNKMKSLAEYETRKRAENKADSNRDLKNIIIGGVMASIIIGLLAVLYEWL